MEHEFEIEDEINNISKAERSVRSALWYLEKVKGLKAKSDIVQSMKEQLNDMKYKFCNIYENQKNNVHSVHSVHSVDTDSNIPNIPKRLREEKTDQIHENESKTTKSRKRDYKRPLDVPYDAPLPPQGISTQEKCQWAFDQYHLGEFSSYDKARNRAGIAHSTFFDWKKATKPQTSINKFPIGLLTVPSVPIPSSTTTTVTTTTTTTNSSNNILTDAVNGLVFLGTPVSSPVPTSTPFHTGTQLLEYNGN